MSTIARPTAQQKITPEVADRIRRDPPERLTLAEASIYLGLSSRTVAEYVKTKRLRAVKVSKSYIFSLKNLRAFIDA